MTTPGARHVELDRAYVQSKVIATNLQHLAVVLSPQDAELCDDLASFTERFSELVLRLNHASNVAAATEATARNEQRRHATQSVGA